MNRILGLDIGTTSIGFALIEWDRPSALGQILHMGARIFPEARDPDGTPLNQKRRTKRMIRRQLRRRRQRRRALNHVLSEAGLLPKFGSPEWAVAMDTDPVLLRARGLSDALAPFELGRALYHLAQRRHFKGRDLGDEPSTEEADETKAESARESTLNLLKKTGQTLGQMLAEKGPHDRQRGIHANRSAVVDEFDRLWEAQTPYHKALQTLGFRDQIAEMMFAQRPVFWRQSTLGTCRFMPDQPLCPKGSWISQQRRMLEKVNNLAISGGHGRPLDAAERGALLTRLQVQASMSWGGVRAVLKPLFKARGEDGGEKALRFNLEEGGDRVLLGNSVEARLAQIFGDEWQHHPYRQAIRNSVPQCLWDADYGRIGEQRVVILSANERNSRRKAAVAALGAEFHLTSAQVGALTELTFPAGWEPFSMTALQVFMPYLEAGVRLGTLMAGSEWEAWRSEQFPNRDRPTGEVFDCLPSPASKEERDRLAGLRNPTVVRTQNELRKVVNNLIRLYGKPDLIRVEMARDVGASKREREEIKDANRKLERRRKIGSDELRKNGIEPSRADVEKWLLWKETQERCPYTGDQISFDALFRLGTYDREHIWPRSRTFDDGFRNKTLCRRDVNIAKGNRTPFEFFAHRPDEWNAICRRLDGFMAKKGSPGMSPGKIKRFLAPSIPDDFAARQLTDTGYAARQAIGFLRRLWPDVGPSAPANVQAVSGRVTAQLRRLWGLNNILADDGEKTRADHRHHAIDALVVACTHPGMTQQLSRYWQDRECQAAVPRLELPWATIRQDATRATDKIVVSHRVRKKVSGPLHDELPFGYTGKDIRKRGVTYGIYVKRIGVAKVPMDALRISSVEDMTRTAKFVVRDEGVRRALLAHLEAAGGNPDRAYPPYPRVSVNGPEIHTVRALTIQQKHLMVRTANGSVDPSSNHHIAIYRQSDDNVVSEVVTLHEGARRLAAHEPIVRRRRDGAAFLMSLSPGDAVNVLAGERSGLWVVCGVWASGQVVLERTTDAVHSTTWLPRPSAIVKAGGQKVSIDPIGQIRKAHD